MSTTASPDVEHAIDRCRPADATPVTLDADALPGSRDGLRELQNALDSNDLVPAAVTVEARFDEPCSYATQDEADRVRECVRSAAFLGAGTVTVEFDGVADESKVRPALAAVRERARREGVTLDIDGPLTLE